MSGQAKTRSIASGASTRLLKQYRRGDYRGVVATGEKLARRERLPADACLVMAASYDRIGQLPKAGAMYQAAVAAAPEQASNHRLLADLLRRQGQGGAALAVCEQGLALHPQSPELLFLYGSLLRQALRPVDALNAFCRLLEIQPNHADAIAEMGVVLAGMGQLDRATEAFCTVLMLEPYHADAIRNLAQTLTVTGRLDEAIAIFRRGLERDPKNHFLRLRKCYQQLHICDWSDLAETADLFGRPDQLSDDGTPFAMLAFVDDPAVQLRHSRRLAADLQRAAGPAPRPALPARGPGERIRIGYLSGDFHDHATMHLMAGLFREHDRTAFEITALSIGPDYPEQAMRRLLVSHVDSFVDLSRLSDADAAARIRAAGLDILIDLKGYTKDCRTGILARRPAPLQIDYVGYPGSMGADFIDYLIADEVVIPPAERAHYSESIIYLPSCYQPTDDQRPIAAHAPSRAELGLPEHAFVFCCFNQTYKITPDEFDLWTGLLHEIEGSVLWLLACNTWAMDNLRAEAQRRGIDPQRLVFADILPQDKHLARIARADLFLDTFRYNAHTTMSDALWAGIPAVSLAGRQFSARVGASVLTSAGLADQVVHSVADYQALCLALARDPARLAALRHRVAAARQTAPLFNTRNYTRAYEAALRQALERARSGQPPADFRVAEAG